MRTDKRFDKFVGNKFERTKCGPQGGGQDARSNPPGPATYQSPRMWVLVSVLIELRTDMKFNRNVSSILECSTGEGLDVRAGQYLGIT